MKGQKYGDENFKRKEKTEGEKEIFRKLKFNKLQP